MYEGPVNALIEQLGRLPGIGPKSAQRLAFHVLNSDAAEMQQLTEAIEEVKRVVRTCETCFNISVEPRCSICRDDRRNAGLLCVVEEPRDVVAIERTREFSGRYHVLGGAISPLDGVGPDDLHLRELVARLDDEEVGELVIATNHNHEGEATAAYLRQLLAERAGLRVTRLASGLPVGGDLDYADEVTLGRAFAGRTTLG